MDARNRDVEALVLRSTVYREKDRLLTLLSAEAGLEKALARGAATPQGKLRGIAQPFCRVSVELTPAKQGLSLIAGGLPLESYLPPGGDLRRFACASYWTELTLHAAVPGKPAPELYAPLLAAWSLLKADDDLARTSRFFELRFLDGQGLLPPLQACAHCARPLPPLSSYYIPTSSSPPNTSPPSTYSPSAPKNTPELIHPSPLPLTCPFYLEPEEGALICGECARERAGPGLTGETVAKLAALASCPLPEVPTISFTPAQARAAMVALRVFLEYRLEYASQVRRVARKLLE